VGGGAGVHDPRRRALERHLLESGDEACLVPGRRKGLGELRWGEGGVGLLWRRAQQTLPAPPARGEWGSAVAGSLAGPSARLSSQLGGPWIETEPRAGRVGGARGLTALLVAAAALPCCVPPPPPLRFFLGRRCCCCCGTPEGAEERRQAEPQPVEEGDATRAVLAVTEAPCARRSSFRASWSRAMAKVMPGVPAMKSQVVLNLGLAPRRRLRTRVLSATCSPASRRRSAACLTFWP
jgi:hypothetical protein